MLQHRPRPFILAAAGLAALVLALIATPDSQVFVLGAWVLVLAGVAAVFIGIVLGFRRQAQMGTSDANQAQYLTADWVGGAQLFTVGDRAEPPPPEPAPDPVTSPAPVPAVRPHPEPEPEVQPVVTNRQWGRYPRVAAAVTFANGLRELIRTTRATQ
ncbi:MAG: hypothetical protein JO155_09600 [Acidimicrobiia bacterium]|nr:hypothetical protein [Acidimicrobiia bacterium]